MNEKQWLKLEHWSVIVSFGHSSVTFSQYFCVPMADISAVTGADPAICRLEFEQPHRSAWSRQGLLFLARMRRSRPQRRQHDRCVGRPVLRQGLLLNDGSGSSGFPGSPIFPGSLNYPYHSFHDLLPYLSQGHGSLVVSQYLLGVRWPISRVCPRQYGSVMTLFFVIKAFDFDPFYISNNFSFRSREILFFRVGTFWWILSRCTVYFGR